MHQEKNKIHSSSDKSKIDLSNFSEKHKKFIRDKISEYLNKIEKIDEDIWEKSDNINQDQISSEHNTEEKLAELSPFSTEVKYEDVRMEDSFLTVEEFNALPDEGLINPYKLRTAQEGINSEFRALDEKEQKNNKTKKNYTFDETRNALIKDPAYTNNIPPLEIGIYHNKVYSFDTRRLIIHMQAKENNSRVQVRYKKISGDYLQDKASRIHEPHPWNGAVTAIRYGGINSSSSPYINPALRLQLEERVNKIFKFFPSERDEA